MNSEDFEVVVLDPSADEEMRMATGFHVGHATGIVTDTGQNVPLVILGVRSVPDQDHFEDVETRIFLLPLSQAMSLVRRLYEEIEQIGDEMLDPDAP